MHAGTLIRWGTTALKAFCCFFVPAVAVSAPYTLSLAPSNGVLVISWPAEYIGAQLQQATNLESWFDVSQSVITNRIALPASNSRQFFRLFAPSIPTVGLVARYDFNGDANDSVGGHNAVIHSATPTSNRFTNGTSAYAFEGMGDYIEIADHDDFSISTTGEFSLSAWIRPGALTFPNSEGSGYVYWMGKGTSYGTGGDQEWACRMYSATNSEVPVRTNRISFYVFNPPGGQGAGSYVQNPVQPQVWIHFVATVSIAENTIRWYRNGILGDTDALIDAIYNIMPKNGSSPVRLGTMNFDSYFIGSIDNVLFYNRVLSPFEVKQLYQDKTR